ncbi:type IV pilus twitching motility protein PilT [Candidatus Vampirococcus lugosii]|uniref:Tfp pilus assembly protein PilT, pilus retraction ATPase n=1 Tax=Candidatus Vampirococcus lugosii TaxID=2789015 RepID=A0ABS5QK63_9BACT|nr:PilT/PilU family type 4a pilus ATPase [Candidatus Vampirococcus lugosii]MBS8121633.1 Tfp pilus assembly protein PilT, pilus retraction ATPase [Candidatus Vampirococcus lugosii]
MKSSTDNKFYKIIGDLIKYELSDIHIIEDSDIYVRKNNGSIISLKDTSLDADEIYGFLNDILTASEIDNLVKGSEIDVSYELSGFRFRINAFRSNKGIRLALRKVVSKPQGMEEIGFSSTVKERILSKNSGLILVTGQTGSGKSTSLAAIINDINENKNAHIITLEDPIEYVFENKKSLITQREIGKHSHSRTKAIKYSLRQDPDIIMVGEMRDYETISAVLTLVETGHQVFSTLHTMDSIQTISRIIDSSPTNRQKQVATQLSLALDLIISQCLIKSKTGKNRVPAREILINTSGIANNIRENNLPQMFGILETSMRHGMNTLDQDIARLVSKGIIDINNASPYIRNLESFKNLLKYYSYSNEGLGFNPID